MTKNGMGIEVPAGGDAFDPQGDMVELGASLLGRVIVPVANQTEADALIPVLTPSVANPLFVFLADTQALRRHNGTTWANLIPQDLVAALCYLPSNVTVSPGTPTVLGKQPLVAWTTPTLTAGVSYDPATGGFTVARAGLYQLGIGAVYDANTSGANRLAWVQNGTGTRLVDVNAFGSNAVTKVPAGTRAVRLTAGTVLYPYTYHDAGGALNVLGGASAGSASYFEIVQISA